MPLILFQVHCIELQKSITKNATLHFRFGTVNSTFFQYSPLYIFDAIPFIPGLLHYGKINLLGWLFYTFIFLPYFAKKSFSRWAQKNIFLVAGQNIHLTYNMYSQLVIFRRYSIVFFQNHLTFKNLLFPLAKLELWP